jgi:RNA polymerase sigma-70 factor (ECF subfamily)
MNLKTTPAPAPALDQPRLMQPWRLERLFNVVLVQEKGLSYNKYPMEPLAQATCFPDIRWSLILRSRTAESPDSAAKALDELCRVYWQPLYAFLRRLGQDSEAAKDSVQGFLAYFLSRNGFERSGPASGRFRHFLLASLRNYTISELRKQTAQKRGGRVEVVALDLQEAEQVFQTQAPEALTPEAAFDRQWAQTVWSRALARLHEEYRERGKEQLFTALKAALTQDDKHGNAERAAATGLSVSGLNVAVHRMRRRLRDLVVDEISQTVGAQADLQEELGYFLSILSK